MMLNFFVKENYTLCLHVIQNPLEGFWFKCFWINIMIENQVNKQGDVEIYPYKSKSETKQIKWWKFKL